MEIYKQLHKNILVKPIMHTFYNIVYFLSGFKLPALKIYYIVYFNDARELRRIFLCASTQQSRKLSWRRFFGEEINFTDNLDSFSTVVFNYNILTSFSLQQNFQGFSHIRILTVGTIVYKRNYSIQTFQIKIPQSLKKTFKAFLVTLKQFPGEIFLSNHNDS